MTGLSFVATRYRARARADSRACVPNAHSTNLVVSFASELLNKAGALINTGLHPSEIVAGYKKAAGLLQSTLEQVVLDSIGNVRDQAVLAHAIKSVVASKFYGYEDLLAALVAEACVYAMSVEGTGKASLSVDNVRVVKLPGGSIHASSVVRGMVLLRPPMGTVTRRVKAGVAVFGTNIEAAQTETKGTVLLQSAEELLKYSGTEEDMLEEQIRGIRDSGVDVVVSGGSVSEMALHFFEKYGMMVVKVASKFELQRICRATRAFPVIRLGSFTLLACGSNRALRAGPVMEEEKGHCEIVEVREIGGEQCVVFEQVGDDSKVATIVLRSSTSNQLDDLERAMDDSINAVKTLCGDARLVGGAGACEIELALRMAAVAEKSTGLEQYPMTKFAEALEVVPRTLAENAGLDPNEVVSRLYAAHKGGNARAGVDVEHEATATAGVLADVQAAGIMDALASKLQALRLAADVAITVLSIDQLIMSKQSGGPQLPKQ